MASSSSLLTPELLRLSSIPLSPLEYFTDSSNTINIKSDVVLVVGEKRFYCHRLLLTLVSPVFVRMFDGPFKEHNEQEIVLEGKSSESILELLKYIYPQFSGQITNDNIEDFLQLADEYMIEHLKQPSKNFLLQQLQLFKFVVLPTQKKLEQSSSKSKSFHASDSALNSPGNNEDNSSGQGNSRRPYSSNRMSSNSRSPTTKPSSSYLKPGDKTGSSNNPSHYVLLLDKTQMPTFYDAHNTQVPFSNNELEIWLRRLQILYQIDKGRNYGEVIDYILSILQFIPATLLLSHIHLTMNTYTTDEIMLNDLARARMFALEEWATDGNPHRSISLTESYRAMSPTALIIAQQATATITEVTDDEENSFQPTVITMSDDEERIHCAKNLLQPEQYKKWLSSKRTEDRIICILEFEKPSLISSVDIGNDGSTFIELLVSQSSSSKPDDWTVLLPSTVFMTPNESRSNKNRNQTKVFKFSHLNKTCLNEEWDRLKIICEQKFNHSNQFGLSFIKLYSTIDDNQQTEICNKSLTDIIDDDKHVSSNVTDELLTRKSINDNKKRTSKRKDVKNDKSQIMKNVVFVLSGFQNPLRSQLRNKATTMGATYNDDWDEKCTHLICAFSNTPKSTQVQETGKGFIVSKQWIIDCLKKNQLLPEKSYELIETKDNDTKQQTPKRKSVTKKRKTQNDEKTTVSKDTKKRTPVKKKSVTVKEGAAKKKRIEEIPDFFHGKHFYVSYGDYEDNTLLDITRVILAYDGILERQITSDTKYVITNRMWNQDFAKISKSNPDINFINLDWLQDCHDANQFVPMQSYLIVP
ncbi:unnamed protein product [Rotaria sp. Silwood2]|nr:unnamed protein product [Rotaria sp. Silwood2]